MIDFFFVVIATPFNIIIAAANEATKPIVSHHKNCDNNCDEASSRPPPPPYAPKPKLYTWLSDTFSRGIANHSSGCNNQCNGYELVRRCGEGEPVSEPIMQDEGPILKEAVGPYHKVSKKVKKMKKKSEDGSEQNEFKGSAPPKE